MAASLEAFEDAVRTTTATVDRIPPDELAATLTEVVDEPAIGAPLPFDEVSVEAVEGWIDFDPTREKLLAAKTGVTGAILGIASYGSLVLRATPNVDELASLFPDRHVVLVRESDVVPDMTAAFDRLGPLWAEEAADVVIATGPSATADMGELVYGVHGPREFHVVVLVGI